jgi:hypothetical protein
MLTRASSRVVSARKLKRIHRLFVHQRSRLHTSSGISACFQWQSSPFGFSSVHSSNSFFDVSCRTFSSAALEVEEGKSIEEQYSKKTPLEHVLLRPGMYVGPVGRLPLSSAWVLEPTPALFEDSQEEEPSQPYRMVQKEFGFIPALIKIFDEILVNASDNKLRDPNGCTKLDVRIDPGSDDREPAIQIWNNGKGIPVQVRSIFS